MMYIAGVQIIYHFYLTKQYSEIAIGMTDAEAEAETPILWSPDVKIPLTRKDPNARKY